MHMKSTGFDNFSWIGIFSIINILFIEGNLL